LQEYLDLTAGDDDLNNHFSLKKKRAIKEIENLKKKPGVHISLVNALKSVELKKEITDTLVREQALLVKMNKIIPVHQDDETTDMEITEINKNLYQQSELNVYIICSKVNNFNLMKLIWEWNEVLFKKLTVFIVGNSKKKDENAYKFQY